MKLEDIKEVYQTTDFKEVNKKLEEGFQIVRILSAKIRTEQIEQIQPCYVVGK